jgi:hypothetical protein
LSPVRWALALLAAFLAPLLAGLGGMVSTVSENTENEACRSL